MVSLNHSSLPSILLACLACLAQAAWADATRIEVGMFSRGDLAGWERKSFSAETDYRLMPLDGTLALQAISRHAASGLYRQLRVDLRQTPYLVWRWRVENTLDGIDEHRKPGDDYPARIYVVRTNRILFWRTIALNYVWSSTQPAGSDWPNAYSARAHMIATRGLGDAIGAWREERRNVREDFRRYLGEEVDEIDVIAIMTDTDNSGLAATAYYGDIHFSSE